MDRQQIGPKLTLDALGVPVRLDSFADRLTVQKSVYLAQAAGVQLGYQFHWYLRGPYSPTLTRDAFGVVAELSASTDDSQGWSLDTSSSKRATALRALIQVTSARASAHFGVAWQSGVICAFAVNSV